VIASLEIMISCISSMKLHRDHEPDTDGIEEQANKALLLAALLDLFREVKLFKISLTCR